uniref:Uncharacterized protein n=1 Tax=Leersia perrieri TaxID=77586 RepID=A0A0D9V6G4_9ORYZ
MAGQLKSRIVAAAVVVASSLVGTASAADGPAPAPASGATTAAPAFAAVSIAAAALGYLFCQAGLLRTCVCVGTFACCSIHVVSWTRLDVCDLSGFGHVFYRVFVSTET